GRAGAGAADHLPGPLRARRPRAEGPLPRRSLRCARGRAVPGPYRARMRPFLHRSRGIDVPARADVAAAQRPTGGSTWGGEKVITLGLPPGLSASEHNQKRVAAMADEWNKYEPTAAREHGQPGRETRPKSMTIDIHAHVAVPEAAEFVKPHL